MKKKWSFIWIVCLMICFGSCKNQCPHVPVIVRDAEDSAFGEEEVNSGKIQPIDLEKCEAGNYDSKVIERKK